jgi:hypothetical protein
VISVKQCRNGLLPSHVFWWDRRKEKNVRTKQCGPTEEETCEVDIPPGKAEPRGNGEREQQGKQGHGSSLPPNRLNRRATKRAFIVWRTGLDAFAQVHGAVRAHP